MDASSLRMCAPWALAYRGTAAVRVNCFTPCQRSLPCEMYPAPADNARRQRLLAVVARPGLGQSLQRLGLQHDDRAMLEPHPVAGRPGPQLLVDAFPCHADHFADFLLGNRNGSAL